MNARTILATAVLALAVIAASALAGEPKHEMKGPPNPAFEKIKMLVGDWEGKMENGTPVTVSYALISGASTLMETLGPAKEPMMVTMYHADGPAALLVTHYCDANNQPRMRAKVPSGEIKSLSFDFVDVSNLDPSDPGYMHHLTLTFEDADHFSQEWTWKEKDKEGKEGKEVKEVKEVFRYTRKKA